MRTVVEKNTIHFFDEENNEIMYMDHSIDECIWGFLSSNKITISSDMRLYSLLLNFMSQTYAFPTEEIQCSKDKNSLTWYSDCYYNPDDEWSTSSVSALHIERQDEKFVIWCTKKIDEIIDRKQKSHCICFSPCGNGRYTKNLESGLTLQDDFVTKIYQPMLNKDKVYKKI